MRRLAYTLFLWIGVSSFLTSCHDRTVFYQYEHTPVAGWEKNDTLAFDIPPLAAGGSYQEQLDLRTMGSFPFMKLTLIVNQTVFPHLKDAEKTMMVDTVVCDLIDKKGVTKGQGISYYQYAFPINMYRFNAMDSVHITIRHDMKREILPGISDIGVKVTSSR